MGKPRFSRKKFETPSHPWKQDRIKEENELIRKYGLKNKKEVWKAETKLRRYRGEARGLLAKVETDAQAKKESEQLLMHLTRYNILPAGSNLDDVLALDTEKILSRRLQTVAYLKGLAKTPKQARQFIIHGHVSVDGRKVSVPSYMVTKNEEGKISYTGDSALNDNMHPERPRAEFKPSSVKDIGKKPDKKEEAKKDKKSVEEDKKQKKPEDITKDKAKEQEKTEEKPDKETEKKDVDKKEESKDKKTQDKAKEKKDEVKEEKIENKETKKEEDKGGK